MWSVIMNKVNKNEVNKYKPVRVGNKPESIEFRDSGEALFRHMLCYRRPYGSHTDNLFNDALVRYITNVLKLAPIVDDIGNTFVKVGDSPTCAFTAHTDTVHSVEGYQSYYIDSVLNHAVVNDDNSSCLGADDTAGIIILIEMMGAGVEGVYCLFRGEEVGGVGSTQAAIELENNPDTHVLGTCNKMISFDRRGYADVITQQGWGVCCSDKFANALASQLNICGLQYKPDDSGIYTDSAEFVGIINECTNVSVGYDFEHTVDEYQDIGFLFDYLIPACVSLCVDSLPVHRDPTVDDGYGGYPTYSFNNNNSVPTLDNTTELLIDQCLNEIRAEELAAFFTSKGIKHTDFISYCANKGIVCGVL